MADEQSDIIMMITGVTGESKKDQKDGYMDLMSWNWSVSQAGTGREGRGQAGGKASAGDFTIVKKTDVASPTLMLFVSGGAHIDTIELYCRKTVNKTTKDYIWITLKQCMLSSFSTGGHMSAAAEVAETFSINFAAITFRTRYIDEDGNEGSWVEYEWSFREVKQVA